MCTPSITPMDPTEIIKSLCAEAVAFLMNTIEIFTGDRQLSQENAQLRQQMANYNDLRNENARLNDELLRRNQAQNTAKPSQHESKNNQNSQSNLSQAENIKSHQTPTSPHQTNTMSSHSIGKPQISQETEEDAILRAQVAHYRQQHAELLQQYEKLNEEMKRKKIDSFEALVQYDKEAMKTLLELARLTEPIPLQGINIGFFGLTSTGKSTMLNSVIGKQVAETGIGETTKIITPYDGKKFILWDIPGRNDEVSYFTMEYISFFKGLSQRLILIEATVQENTSIMKLLDGIGLNYDIVFNKFDTVEPQDQEAVKTQIHSEIQRIGLQRVNKVYFVSAKKPNMFPDWVLLMNQLENPSN